MQGSSAAMTCRPRISQPPEASWQMKWGWEKRWRLSHSSLQTRRRTAFTAPAGAHALLSVELLRGEGTLRLGLQLLHRWAGGPGVRPQAGLPVKESIQEARWLSARRRCSSSGACNVPCSLRNALLPPPCGVIATRPHLGVT
jgi:hypothetical protein